jgi:hypothetical protein
VSGKREVKGFIAEIGKRRDAEDAEKSREERA